MKGRTGKILRINLSNRRHETEALDPETQKLFLGGHGVAAKILMDEMDPKVAPFSPDNKLIFSIGPLTGTAAPLGSRYMITAKSPLTGLLGFGNSGGYFGPAMRNAGYDQIVIEGKADKPVYILISDEDIEFRDAGHLWGKDSHATEDMIVSETKDSGKRVRVSCIGPAGEKLVRIAAVMNDKHRAVARCGMGAVMGSKNLKALAVRGSNKDNAADNGALKSLANAALKKIKANPEVESFTQFGTAGVMILVNEMGILPTRNFQRSTFERAMNISGEFLTDKYLEKHKACYGCPIACGRGTRVSDKGYEGQGEGPEYETLAMLGANLGNSNLAAVTKANYICNRLGLDTISAGGTIACALEMFEKGYISEKETGIALRFGDEDLVIKLVEMIGNRSGFGDILAEGGYRVAEKYGHPECFMGLHKMEMPGYEPRGAKGMGINYITSPIGPSHCRGYTIPFEILHTIAQLDPIGEQGKALPTKAVQDMTCAIDVTGLCLFAINAIGMEDLIPMLIAATGTHFDQLQFLRIGERIFNLQRLFNLSAGLKTEDERLPERFYKEPLPDGPNAGAILDLEQTMAEYYNLRGWDEDRVPYYGKLKGLGLAEYAIDVPESH